MKPLKKWNFWLVWGGARSASKEMRGHKSYVMRFLADFVLDTPEKHAFAFWGAKVSIERGCVDRGPHEVPGRLCC